MNWENAAGQGRSDTGESARRSLLVAASEPAVTMADIQSAVLKAALDISQADLGGAIQLCSRPDASVAQASALGIDRESAVLLLRDRGAEGGCLANQTAEAIEFPVRRSGSTDGRRLRSALLYPLIEHRRPVASLCLMSSKSAAHWERARGRLEGLAAVAATAIRRVQLRQRFEQIGVDLDLVGISESFLELERQTKVAATYPGGTVLILGERGCGKELLAHAIHAWSDRRDKPFVPILSSALSESLVADELYGHERDSFTGASRHREGKFQAADGGTVFLDEVADMPAAVQSSLLRVVERGEMQKVGRDRPTRVDVRVVAATNRNLAEMVANREFRTDLYDRLSIFEIRVPPLRERREDIPLLANYFLRKYCRQIQRFLHCGAGAACGAHGCSAVALRCVDTAFYQALQDYDWPGNIRELANLMLRLQVTVEGDYLDASHLPPAMREARPGRPQAPPEEDFSLDNAIRSHIGEVLRRTGNNQSQAARLLGLPYSTLQSKIQKLGIHFEKN